MSTIHKPQRPPTIGVVPVETRSKTKMFRVDYNGIPIGIVEKMPDTRTDTNPWKATLGIGFKQTFLGVVYATRKGAAYQAVARETAVDAVIAAHEGKDVSWAEFEKSHDAQQIIDAWRNVPQADAPVKALYPFNFVPEGFNYVWASTEAEAIDKAKKEFPNWADKINLKSFRRLDTKEKQAAFWASILLMD